MVPEGRMANGSGVGWEALPQPRRLCAAPLGPRGGAGSLAATQAHARPRRSHCAFSRSEHFGVGHAFARARHCRRPAPNQARHSVLSRSVQAACLVLAAAWLLICFLKFFFFFNCSLKKISGIKLYNHQYFFPDVCYLRLRLCNPKCCPPAPQPRNP